MDLSHPWLNLLLSVLLFLVLLWMGYFFFSDISLLVYRNTTDFCVILYPATLIHLLISSNSFFFWLSLRIFYVSVQFSRSVISDSLRPHGLQQARPPFPSPAPGACSNSCPSSRWCHPAVSSSHPLLLLPSVFPSIRVFSNESILCIRWPAYWSFSLSVSPYNEYSGLISFRMDWLDLLAVQGTLKSSPTPQFKSINSSVLSFLYGPTLTSAHDYWKNHSFD